MEGNSLALSDTFDTIIALVSSMIIDSGDATSPTYQTYVAGTDWTGERISVVMGGLTALIANIVLQNAEGDIDTAMSQLPVLRQMLVEGILE